MREDTALVSMVWLISAAFAVFIIGGTLSVITREHYPESTADCPPGHVYIDHGETPQAGCWPEGAARQIGVYPEPEEP